jgi:hypothetical protein
VINHIRTLLLNLPQAVGAAAGDEYVPTEARTRTLTPRLASIRKILLGASPDRLFANYRLYMLMQAIHESSLADLAIATDARLTYLRRNGRMLDDFPSNAFGITQTVIAGDEAVISQSSTMPLIDPSGICKHRIRLQVDSDTVTWRWLSAARPPLTIAKPAAGSNGLLDLALPPGGYVISVSDVPGTTLLLDVAYEPTETLQDIIDNLQDIGVAVTDAIMGGTERAVPPAPYDRLLQSWQEPKTPLDRVAAAALTLAYRTEELA